MKMRTNRRLRRFIFLLLAAALLLPQGWFVPVAEAATTSEIGDILVAYDFENGQGDWTGNGAEAAVTGTLYRSGKQSLLTTGRNKNYEGPSIVLTDMLEKGAEYEISGFVKLQQGEQPTRLKFTMEQPGASNQWKQVAELATVTDSDWVELKGTYTCDPAATSLKLYFESENNEASNAVSFALDDVAIRKTKEAPAPSAPKTKPQEIIHYNFDDGTTQGWGPRDSGVSVEASDEQAKSDQYSLKTTSRTKNWHGPTVSVIGKVAQNAKYEVSASVRLVTAPASTSTIKLTAELNDDGTKSWSTIAQTEISNTEWVELNGSFSFNAALTDLQLYVESSNPDDSYYVDDVLVKMTEAPPAALPIQTDLAKLKDVYSEYFQIGAAMEPFQTEGINKQLLDLHYNSIVAENAMKPGSLNPANGVYTFANADRIAQFARDNGLHMRFHTLVWHSQAADWMFKTEDGTETLTPTPENKQLVLNRLKEYIGKVVPRYADIASSWDVVNEVIDEGRPDGMRNSLWYELTGEDYIRTAFSETRKILDEMYAKEPVKYAIAKEAKLYINDYSTHHPQKAKFLFDLATKLKKEGVPIDGVGHQTHINISGPSIKQISDSIKMFGEAGFDNQLTELDVSIYTNNTDAYKDAPQDLLDKQGFRYKELFEELKKLDDMGRMNDRPEGWISSVTFWGIADDHTWLHNRPITRQDAPFPFDKNFQAKPAYWGMVDPTKLAIVRKTTETAYGSPVIDKSDDAVWHTVPAVQLETGEQLAAAMKTLWDENNLYVKTVVTDDSKSPGDGVELFVNDGGKIKRVTIARGSATSAETAGGYVIEAKIPLSDTSAIGRTIPFDIHVSDSGSDDGSEHGKNGSMISWSDLSNNQDNSSENFGELTLIAGVKTAKAIYGTPVLDGKMDAVWNNAAKQTTNVKVEGGEGSKAEFRTMWDDRHLYVYAVVTDKLLSAASINAWEQDSVEVFVDQNNGKTSAYESDDGQYRINYNNVGTVGGHASQKNFRSATKIDGSGYIVEAAIDLDTISPKNGAIIGFDFQVNNDDNGTGKRDSVWIWNDPTGQSYQNTAKLGVLELTGKIDTGNSANTMFGDLDTVPWAKKAIEELASRGIIRGTTETTYDPLASITRANFLAMLVRALALKGTGESKPMFSDIAPSDAYYEEMKIAIELGIASGVGNNRFLPNNKLTREDMMVLTTRAMKAARKKLDGKGSLDGFSDLASVAEYAKESAIVLVSSGIVNGIGGNIAPKEPLTRAQAAVILYQISNN